MKPVITNNTSIKDNNIKQNRNNNRRVPSLGGTWRPICVKKIIFFELIFNYIKIHLNFP